MRKLILLFLIFACAFAQAQQKPVSHTQPAAQPAPAQAKPAVQAALQWCRLGVDPVDATRQPQWGVECIVKSASVPVTMATGSGKHVRCLLPPLTPVVVDRGTGIAKWVLACGNPLLEPANWVPQGTRICGPEQPAQQTAAPPAPAATPAAPAAPQAPPALAEMRVSGEVRVVHEGEVRLVHEVPAPEPTSAPQPRRGWWARNWRWVVPVAIAAGAGAAVALTRGGGMRQQIVVYQPLPPPVKR